MSYLYLEEKHLSEQNCEKLLQTICKIEKIQVEITKSADFSWQIALAYPPSVGESLVLEPSLEEEKSSDGSKSVNLPTQALNLDTKKTHEDEVKNNLVNKSEGNISEQIAEVDNSILTNNNSNITYKDTEEQEPTKSGSRKSTLPSKKKRQKKIKVFISYCHDNEEHKRLTKELVDKLMDKGVHCIFDEYEKSKLYEQWSSWMIRKIEEAKFVIIVCNKEYINGIKPLKARGVTGEGAIIREEIYNKSDKKPGKFIPIFFSKNEKKNIPTFLRGFPYYLLDEKDTDKYNEDYKNLYRYITNQPKYIPPKIGEIEIMPPERYIH
jgi:SEFIR domain